MNPRPKLHPNAAPLEKLHAWTVGRRILHDFTTGTRILLAAGFIPTGLVKLLGNRFSQISVEYPIGAFFETLYQSGIYWNFIGAAQILAGLLLLFPATATLGAVLFVPIILNIFVITVSLEFRGTPIVTGLILLANVYLLCWDGDRLRHLLPGLGAGTWRGTEIKDATRGLLRYAWWGVTPCAIAVFCVTRGLIEPRTALLSFIAPPIGAGLDLFRASWNHRRTGTTNPA